METSTFINVPHIEDMVVMSRRRFIHIEDIDRTLSWVETE